MTKPQDEEPITLLMDRALNVNLDLHPYRLVPGFQGEVGLPIEAFLVLYAVRENRPVAQIRTPSDLSRFVVNVRNEDEALSFVQLFTAPATSYLFHYDETVIDLAVIPDLAPPCVGTVAASAAQRLEIQDLRVRRGPEGFTIVRSLVRASSLSGPRTVLRRAECVSQDGQYVLLAEERLGELPASAVLLPYYE